ncbi:mechanosensitive ion channel [Roseicyclus sp. F158]|uniref:Mechanosensitive ion channel n=1 Tax=Tropicimonas omnivorans TaxID=3075590 RepID=A0ABU3DH51_9RHOB|nr:mechanosensitive ion channel domain-containing protein [Roseicyclus sp. F158]MDT0682888.1 mechanosensitive ion channel [Roseicyclus sp. F158]
MIASFLRPLAGMFLLFLVAGLPAHAQQGAGSLATGPGSGGSGSSSESGEFFSQDTVNAGLGELPGWVDRSTPQGTMESFRAAAEAEDWQAAAHLLNLGDYSEDEQAAGGPVLARSLASVIDRKVLLDWHDLPDRPDGIDFSASGSDPASSARRSIRIWVLSMDKRSVPILLNRVKPENGDAVWLFSKTTVANVPRLNELYGPSRIEQKLPGALRERAFWGLRWWEVLALPILAGAAAIAGFATSHVIQAISRRTRRRLLQDVIDASRWPAIIAVVTFVISTITANLFVFSGQVDVFLQPLTVLGFTIAIMLLLVNGIDRILDRIVSFDNETLSASGPEFEYRRSVATRLAAFRRAAVVIVVVVAAGIVLSSANVFRSVGFTLLASAGALTIILGFAARNVLSNIMASLQISLNQSARIGDRLLFKGYMVVVERINFTYVQLRVWSGERLIVPVTEFTSEVYENWTLKNSDMVRPVMIRLSHSANVEKLRDAYNRILDEGCEKEDWEIGPKEDRGVHVAGHDIFGQEVMFKVPTTDPSTSWVISCTVRERLLEAATRMQEEGETVFPEANPAEAA